MQIIALLVLYLMTLTARSETPTSISPMRIPFHQQFCVNETTKDCRKGVCTSHVPENCSSTCYTYAKQKCKALSEQKEYTPK